MEDKDSPTIPAKKVLLVSFAVDVIDVVLGVTATIMTGSAVMFSEALEGVADLVSSGLLVLGLNRSRKKPDANYPFGYGRELYFWTLISALLMLTLTSSLTIFFGWHRLFDPEPVVNTNLASLVLLLSMITNGYALSLSVRRLLNKKPLRRLWTIFYNSSLIETKTSFVLDLMGTSASVLGFFAILLFTITRDAWFDSLGAIAIGISLAVFAFFLLIAIKDFLIGKSVPIQTIDVIKNAVHRVKAVNSVQDLKATHMGPDTIMINIEINVTDNLTTDQLEKIIDRVKDEIRKDLPSASHIQVELESPS